MRDGNHNHDHYGGGAINYFNCPGYDDGGHNHPHHRTCYDDIAGYLVYVDTAGKLNVLDDSSDVIPDDDPRYLATAHFVYDAAATVLGYDDPATAGHQSGMYPGDPAGRQQ